MTDPNEAAIRGAVEQLVGVLLAAVHAEAQQPGTPDRLLSIAEAAERLGVGRSRLYGEIASGALRTVKVGRRRLVPSSAITDFASRPDGR